MAEDEAEGEDVAADTEDAEGTEDGEGTEEEEDDTVAMVMEVIRIENTLNDAII